MPEKKVSPSIKVSEIKHVVFDADNTLWDWVGMHLKGMQAMAQLMAEITGIDVHKITASMSGTYEKAGTMDFKSLVQSMDVIQEWVMEQIMGRESAINVLAGNLPTSPKKPEKPEEESAISLSCQVTTIGNALKMYTDLESAVHKRYTQVRDKEFRIYPGIQAVLQSLYRQGIKLYIVTNAPLPKTIRRLDLKKANLGPYIETIYGPEDKAERDLPHYERVSREGGSYNTRANQVQLKDSQRKPNTDLAELLGLSRKEVENHVAVVGDKVETDMQLAYNNGCLGLYAEYGKPTPEQIAALHKFAPSNVVARNVDLFTSEVAAMIRDMRQRIKFLQKPMDILEILQVKPVEDK